MPQRFDFYLFAVDSQQEHINSTIGYESMHQEQVFMNIYEAGKQKFWLRSMLYNTQQNIPARKEYT